MPFESVRKLADADFPTRWGHFRILGFRATSAAATGVVPPPEEAVAVVMGDLHAAPPLVRVHSQCLTGDVFHSLRCDCRQQLELALATIADAGAGILLYENQEGRGIGLMAKLQAYELQDQGRDTIEANLELGYRADCRAYELQDQGRDTIEANLELGFKNDYRGFDLPAEILKLLKVPAVRLITNNPEKVEALVQAGIEVVERISAEVPSEPTFERYLQTKQEKMGHLVG